MRIFIPLLMVLLATFMLIATDAQAKRFGGGKSFGTQRASNTYSRAQPLQSAGQNMANRASRWAAPLMGLAAGALLASLFMGHGLGSAILSWLAIGVACMFIFSLVRRFRSNTNQPVFHNLNNQQAELDRSSPYQNQPLNFASSTASAPTGFDSETFLRDAKSLFIRLQTAYDQKNLNDLRKFTTPEVFAEIQLQLQERGNANNETEVISLNSQLLGVAEEPQITIHGQVTVITASVRFSGMIREEQNEPTSVNEVWHFQKDRMGSEWNVTGLQQE